MKMAEFKIGLKIMRLPDVIAGMKVIMAQDRIINMQKRQFKLARIMKKYNIDQDMITAAQGAVEEKDLPKEYIDAMFSIEPDDLSELQSFQTVLVKESILYYQELGAEFTPKIDEWTANELTALVSQHNIKIQDRIMGEKVLPDLGKKAPSQ